MAATNHAPILVADDDVQDMLLLKLAAERSKLDLSLQSVTDGEQAIDYLLGQKKYKDRQTHPFPRFLLLDLKMPRLGGFEVLNFIRRQPGLKQLPVIILSSSDDPKDIRRAYEAGANSYLCKPHTNEGLVDMLKALEAYWLKFNHFPPCD
jgi:CheY-like chemotaxis protein